MSKAEKVAQQIVDKISRFLPFHGEGITGKSCKANAAKEIAAILEPHLAGETEQKVITDATAWAKAINMRISDDDPGEAEVAATSQLYESVMQLYSQKLSAPPKGEQS